MVDRAKQVLVKHIISNDSKAMLISIFCCIRIRRLGLGELATMKVCDRIVNSGGSVSQQDLTTGTGSQVARKWKYYA